MCKDVSGGGAGQDWSVALRGFQPSTRRSGEHVGDHHWLVDSHVLGLNH